MLRDERRLYESASLWNIMKHLNVLKFQLQEWDCVIKHMCDAMKDFQVNLHLQEMQMQKGNLCHFPCCQENLTRS